MNLCLPSMARWVHLPWRWHHGSNMRLPLTSPCCCCVASRLDLMSAAGPILNAAAVSQSVRDGITEFRDNLVGTKSRIEEASNRINGSLGGFLEKKYWCAIWNSSPFRLLHVTRNAARATWVTSYFQKQYWCATLRSCLKPCLETFAFDVTSNRINGSLAASLRRGTGARLKTLSSTPCTSNGLSAFRHGSRHLHKSSSPCFYRT